jgi:hypothetical protein
MEELPSVGKGVWGTPPQTLASIAKKKHRQKRRMREKEKRGPRKARASGAKLEIAAQQNLSRSKREKYQNFRRKGPAYREQTCPICIGRIRTTNKFKSLCNHWYHQSCYMQLASMQNPKCALCRHML